MNKDIEQYVITESGKEIELEAGRYMVKVHLCQTSEYDFTLTYYGTHAISMRRIKNVDKWDEEGCSCHESKHL